MINTHEVLLNEVLKLPVEKVGKALSFVRFLLEETEEELHLDSAEEMELYQIIGSNEFATRDDMLSKIMELDND